MQSETWDVVIDMVAFSATDAASPVRACTGRAGHYVACSTVVTQRVSPTSLWEGTVAPAAGSGPSNRRTRR